MKHSVKKKSSEYSDLFTLRPLGLRGLQNLPVGVHGDRYKEGTEMITLLERLAARERKNRTPKEEKKENKEQS
jgi:hypothetical protein